jgi:hypothetical protein
MNSLHFNTLVLAGGGSGGGVSIAGALNYLNENNLLDNITRYCGTSVGSLIIALIVIGYDPLELAQHVVKNFKSSIFLSIPFIPYNIYSKHGLFSNDHLIKYMGDLYEAKGVSRNITFKELYVKTNKTIVITGTSLNTRDTFYFSHNTFPDMRVLEAVKISTSIPFFFTSTKLKISNIEHIMVDGAVLNNFPLYYFDLCDQLGKFPKNGNELITLCNSTLKFEAKYDSIIAIDIISDDVDENGIFFGFNKVNNFFDFLNSFLGTIMNKISSSNYVNNLEGRNEYKNNVIQINIKGYLKAIDLYIDEQSASELQSSGYTSAKKTIEILKNSQDKK